MIEESFLKSNFVGRDGLLWWVGQVAPEKAQGEQINGGGWGNRVKVRIMGYHPHSLEELPDEDLPWAQILLPSTAGSGKGGRATSVKLSPGDNVMGFFMDGEDAQLPVIFGILGSSRYAPVQDYAGPFQPYTGFTSKIEKANVLFTKGESNEMNASTNESPRLLPPETVNKLKSTLKREIKGASSKLGQTISFAGGPPEGAINEISNELENVVSDIKNSGLTGSALKGRLDSAASEMMSSATKLSGMMTKNLVDNGLVGQIQGGLDKAYKVKYAAELAATGSDAKAKVAGAAMQASFMPAIQGLEDAIPCVGQKILGSLKDTIKGLLGKIAENVKNFVKCVAQQFVGGIMNGIIGGLTKGFSGLLGGGIGDLLGGFDIGGFLRGGAKKLMNLSNVFKCNNKQEYDFGIKEWVVGKGPKNAIDIGVDAILDLANAADQLSGGIVGGIQNLSIATGSLGMFDFLNPSVSVPGNKSSLGDCYAGPPTKCGGLKVEIFGGGGAGAIAKGILGSIVNDGAGSTGSIIGIDLLSGGIGYKSPPFIEITDDCKQGYGASARSEIDLDEDSPTYGQITDIYIVTQGENYPVPEPELESKPPYVVDHVVVVKPGIGYTSTDSFTDNDGNTYKPYIDNSGRIVRLSPPDPEKFNVKNVEQLPKIKIVSETGSGAILKPSLKPRPEYQGEIKEVIDCIS
tara:strand:+ start:66 stop:2129 length:2064 start_codon:yes stop_codon:yes gene_type:complete